jgi:hypothetical protein
MDRDQVRIPEPETNANQVTLMTRFLCAQRGARF